MPYDALPPSAVSDLDSAIEALASRIMNGSATEDERKRFHTLVAERARRGHSSLSAKAETILAGLAA